MTVNVDVVRAEFEKLLRQAESVNEKAAQALEQTLRPNFADGDGRLPRTLEQFLGDRGALRSMVDELFDESKRDSAIGRIGSMLERYFDGDASKLAAPARSDPAQLADAPVPPGDGRRVQARSRSASSRSRRPPPPAAPNAPGRRPRAATSRTCSRRCSATSPAAPATCSTGPGPRPGAVMKSKKGDFVLTLDARVARGCDVRVVIEAKDRPMSMRAMRDELREARENRGAAVALVVFTPAHAPSGVAPFDAGRRRRLLRHRPGGAGAGHARGGRPAGPAARARLARRARGRGRRRGDRRPR